MRILRKIKNRIKGYFRKPFVAIIPQEYAKELQVWDTWGGNKGLFSTSYEAISAAINKNKKAPLFYNTQKFWNLKSVKYARFEQQKAFIESAFIPLLKKNDTLLDMGCANGEWTFMFAPYVKEVKAYDLSAPLIEGAKEIQAKDYPHIHNITFAQGEVGQLNAGQIYDCISFMGVLSYVLEWENVQKILTKLYTILRGGDNDL